MRCPECGYMNDDSAQVCIKCGTKLKSGEKKSQNPAFNTPKKESPDSSSQGAKTMRGRTPDMPPAEDASPSSVRADSIIKCPSCSYYPLRSLPGPGHACPNCGFEGEDVEKKRGSRASSEAKTVKIGEMEIGNKQEATIHLREEGSGELTSLSGECIEINRPVLSPGNPSISASLHAVFSFDNGILYLEDKSSNGATFVQVTEKVKVPQGSKVVIGNKVYTVEIQ